MEYSDDFYYLDEQELDGFSSKPPGRLSVSRLIKGEPCWKKTVRQNVQNKKTVIIDDWTAPSWSYQKKAAVQLKINALIADGFSVYAWSDGALVNLSAHELCFSDQQKMTPASMNEIIEVAASHQLSADKIHVLDDYGVTCLLSEKNTTPPKRVLHLSDYLHSDFNKTKLLDWLQQVTPKVDIFELDILSLERFSGIAEIIEALLPGIEQRISDVYIEVETLGFIDPTKINETTLSIKCRADQVDVNALLSLLAYVTEEGIDPTKSNVPNLQSFQVDDAQNWSCLTGFAILHFLGHSEHLERLTLNQWPHWSEVFPTLSDFKHLASLDISGADINLETLTLMIYSLSPELRELKLSRCQQLSNGELYISEPLNHLESLDLNDAVINAEALTTLLKNTPNLRALHLSGISKEIIASASETIRGLKNLEILTLDTNSVLNVVKSELPKIKKLTVTHWEAEKYKLPSVSSLTIGEGHFNNYNLFVGVLSTIPKCKSLELKDCDSIVPDIPSLDRPLIFKESYNALETLVLNGGSIINLLPELLGHSPNLHTLVLKNCTLTPRILAGLRFKQFSIQQLDIDDDLTISVDGLKKLLDTFPNLKDPSLSSCIQKLKLSMFSEETERAGIATNPVHNPDAMLKKTEPPPDHFKFKGINPHKNQDMIIEKLSQYLTMKNNPSLIPHIQKGICRGLSYWYMSQLHDDFVTKLNSIAEWDGRAEADESLSVVFNEIIVHIKARQLNQKTSRTYLGNHLEHFISTMTAPCILNNPWHVIVIEPIVGDDRIRVYDPNHINGAQCLTRDACLQAIHDSIGSVIAIEGVVDGFAQNIGDPNLFIRNGGLLAIHQCVDIDLHPLQDHAYSSYALQGLLARDNSGSPAWVLGVKSDKTRPFILSLLAQFIQQDPEAKQKLDDSLDALSPFERHELQVALHQDERSPFIEQLSDLIRNAAPNLDYYTSELETWRKVKPFADSLPAYCELVVSNPEHHRNQLIELPSHQSVQAMQLALQDYCLSTSRPVFYINSPDDLLCKSSYIALDEQGMGTLTNWDEGPGSPLLQFILNHPNGSPAPVLIVNYDNFKNSDYVRFNDLLEGTRKADGIPLPENTLIIGLVNQATAYQGADFYSRLDSVEQCPFLAPELVRTIPPLPCTPCPTEASVVSINLCHADDWQDRLLGRMMIQGEGYVFKDGALAAALQSGLPLVIENGLWENTDFQQFWLMAMLHKKIEHAGGVIVLPDNFTFSKQEGYDWPSLSQGLTGFNGMNAQAVAMNPSRLTDCFTEVKCHNETHTLHEHPGIFEAHAHGAVTLTITHPLSTDEWGMLLLERQKHDVNLTCYLAEGVLLPPELAIHLDIQSNPVPLQLTRSTRVIQSTDPDVTIAQLTEDHEDWIVIDISECKACDLLRDIDVQYNKADGRSHFTESFGALHQALLAKKNVILTGEFSPELAHELAPLLLEQHRPEHAASKLILVSEKYSHFYGHTIETQIVSASDKKIQLLKQFLDHDVETILERYPSEPLVQLEARLLYRQYHPDDTTDNAWQGVHTLDMGSRNQPLDLSTSKADVAAFDKQRFTAIDEQLKHAPYVVITGLTAVGKSTFVNRSLSSAENTVFNSLCQVHEWATARGKGRQILFIDEANIGSQQWSQFEGLCRKPPSILIGNTYYPLTDDHKVVFACNPMSYGGRQLPSLFKRHGNAVKFDPLPNAFIYEEIIKPVFQQTPLESSSETIAKALLEVYDVMCQYSKTDVLISPREIQMIALLVLSYTQQHPDVDPLLVAHHYRYALGRPLVPLEHLSAFDDLFLPKQSLPLQTVLSNSTDFMLTPSRQAVKQQLTDLLRVSQTKRQAPLPPDGTDAQRYGGLGGMVIEGVPGIGKSKLVEMTLHELGYTKQTLTSNAYTPKSDDKRYYEMPAHLSYDDKKTMLLRAFHEGAVVVADEINSSSMMEELMNDILTGQTPEKKRPNHPGFMLIATQNPPTMAGRVRTGSALSRRLLHVTLPDYTAQEARDILNNLGLSQKKIDSLMSIYLRSIHKAQSQHLSPAPTFRDLIKLAHHELQMTKKNEIHDLAISTSSSSAEMSNPSTLMRRYKAKIAGISAIAEEDCDVKKSTP